MDIIYFSGIIYFFVKSFLTHYYIYYMKYFMNYIFIWVKLYYIYFSDFIHKYFWHWQLKILNTLLVYIRKLKHHYFNKNGITFVWCYHPKVEQNQIVIVIVHRSIVIQSDAAIVIYCFCLSFTVICLKFEV